MSNFLPDLANWALRGVGGSGAAAAAAEGTDPSSNHTEPEVDEAAQPPTSQMTPQELRAQRVARMEELSLLQQQQQQQQQSPQETGVIPTSSTADPTNIVMDIETPTETTHVKNPPITTAATTTLTAAPPTMGVRSMKKAKNHGDAAAVVSTVTTSQTTSMRSHKSGGSSNSSGIILQRKKEQLLMKCLHIQLVGGSTTTTTTTTTDHNKHNIITVDIGSTEISVTTMAEIIAVRLSMELLPLSTPPGTASPSPLVISYMGSAYNRTMDEIRNISPSTKDDAATTELYDLLQEMKHQIVSYTTTCMVEPDVFPNVSHNIPVQIAQALLNSMGLSTTSSGSMNSTTSTLDYNNITLHQQSSFYTKIMDEFQQQDRTTFTSCVHAIVEYYCTQLLQTDSLLNTITIPPLLRNNNGTNQNSNHSTSLTCTPTNIVTALSTMCLLHKGVAMAMTEYPFFLLPPPPPLPASTAAAVADTTTTSAAVVIGTPPPFVTAANNNSNNSSTSGAAAAMNPLLQLLSGNLPPGNQRLRQPWMVRSGVSIEMGTILGLCLHFGIPKPPQSSNPAFTPHIETLRQSVHTIDSITRTQRQQLLLHQNECYNLIMSLLKVKNPMVKEKIMTWFTDVLLVNFGASALRPDITKVSGTNFLCNVSMMLLKLCQPFVNQEDKQHLIDAQFLYHPSTPHQGVFATTGENAIPRLGGSDVTVINHSNNNGDDAMNVDNDDNDVIMTTEYKPKNAFIPFCFFFCTHSLHISIVPALRQNENLVRRINYLHHEITSRNGGNMDAVQTDRRFAYLIAQQRSEDVSVFQDEYMELILQFNNFTAKVIYDWMNAPHSNKIIMNIPEEFVSDICDIVLAIATLKAKVFLGHSLKSIFQLFVKLLSPEYASLVRNYNLRAQLGDVLHDVFLPRPSGNSRHHHRDVPASITMDPMAGGQTYLLSDASAQETLAPSLLLLYGEVEHTGYFDKMSHRAKIASLIQYLWESSEHRPAFRRITQNKTSFIKFANGIMNETNTLIATVMQKLPEIREAQEKMKQSAEWSRLSEDEQSQINSRLEDNERDVKSSLPLCNKTLQMFGYLNTDTDIRSLFLLPELCSRLVTMLLHVLTKLVGSKGLDLKVDHPEQYDFRPKEMLRDLCAIFALFASSTIFQEECAKSGGDPNLLRSAVRTCRRLHLLEGESMEALASLPDQVDASKQQVAKDEALLVNAPDEFLDEIMSTYMNDPVMLPSGHFVDRSTITQHLLNDPTDPFNREPLTIDQVQPAHELKERMRQWLEEQHQLRNSKNAK